MSVGLPSHVRVEPRASPPVARPASQEHSFSADAFWGYVLFSQLLIWRNVVGETVFVEPAETERADVEPRPGDTGSEVRKPPLEGFAAAIKPIFSSAHLLGGCDAARPAHDKNKNSAGYPAPLVSANSLLLLGLGWWALLDSNQ